MKTVHLKAAAAAAILIASGLCAFVLYAQRVERRSVHAIAPLHTPTLAGTKMDMAYPQMNLGSALQREAFRQSDLLPLFGSSEVSGFPWDATVIFRNYPTGFMVFPVGWADTTCLTFLQEFAAIGSELRGKKVVISLSPSWFFARDMVFAFSYAGNFSMLHASQLAFSTDLSFDVKRAAAERMLEYPETVDRSPLLRFALRNLADGSLKGRLLYYAMFPLGKLQNLVLDVQDHWASLEYIEAQKLSSDVTRRPAALDWHVLEGNADRESRIERDNNPFGLRNDRWIDELHDRAAWDKDTRTDGAFLSMLQRTREWRDFDLMLRTLTELGARPLILSMPIDGTRFDNLGISASARRAYYAKLRKAVEPYGIPLVDFSEFEQDPYFLIDWEEHLSPKGWMHYAEILDAFYHDRGVAGFVQAAAR